MKSETSIFSRVYKYKETDKVNQKENFLTEIFAFVLENDVEVFKRFCKLIDKNFSKKNNVKITENNYIIETQITDKDTQKRPDIQIIINKKTIILVECKVEDRGREGQLENYIQILKNENYTYKYLIYLTKYFETNEINEAEITFKHTRWYEIYNLISNSHQLISKQLRLYLKEENMSMDTKFTKNDITVLSNIEDTISKMDDVLDYSKDYAKKLNGNLLSEQRTLKLKDSSYYFRIEFDLFWLNIGFWHLKKKLSICIEIEKDQNCNDRQLQLLKNIFKNWEVNEIGNYIKYKPIKEFISNNEDTNIIIEFIKNAIDELIDIKKQYSEIFE